MENKMFCFQCEQTAGCSGCTGKVGVCGKNADVAALQDKLTGELIGLVRATGDVVPTGNVLKLIIEGLFTTLTNVSFNEQTLNELIEKVCTERERLVPQCFACASPCGTNNEYDLSHIWTDNEDIRSLKSLILFGISRYGGICLSRYGTWLLQMIESQPFLCESIVCTWRRLGNG